MTCHLGQTVWCDLGGSHQTDEGLHWSADANGGQSATIVSQGHEKHERHETTTRASSMSRDRPNCRIPSLGSAAPTGDNKWMSRAVPSCLPPYMVTEASGMPRPDTIAVCLVGGGWGMGRLYVAPVTLATGHEG